METVHITKVNWKDTDKEGNKLVGKFGPYYKVGFLCNERGAVWINGITSFIPKWEGTTQELEITEDPKWGWQFKLPKEDGSSFQTAAQSQPAPDALRMERKLDAILTEIQTIKPVLGDILRKLQKEDALAGEFNTD